MCRIWTLRGKFPPGIKGVKSQRIVLKGWKLFENAYKKGYMTSR
jgi:hypothetical protein